MAKWVSLVVKFGALVFILFVPQQYAIQLQLLGGIWIIQTLPSVMLGLYTRWFNPLGAADRLGGRHRDRHLDGGVGEFRPDLPARDRRAGPSRATRRSTR